MTIAEELAGFIRANKVVSPSARIAAIRAILDLMTAAVAGFPSQGGKAALQAAQQTWGPGHAACWFTDITSTPSGAAFANSAIASMLDLDDGHRDAAGHPGAAVIPAVFAEADCARHEVEELITAVCIGYEVAIRIARARDFSQLGTLASGLWTAQGVAAAVGYLRRLTTQQLAHALAIAGTTAPNLVSVGYTKLMGNHVKEGIPWSVVTGISAVDLACAGFTGPLDFLDYPLHFAQAALMDDLGKSWLIETAYFKPYSCCRWGHAAIDASLALCKEHALRPDQILSVDVSTFSRTLRLNNDVEPTSLEAAQYSVPFTVALAIIRGSKALLPLREQSLNDQAVIALASRVRLTVDPEFDKMFSAQVPARVKITTKSGVFEKTVADPKGEPTNAMDWGELVDKHHTVGAELIGEVSCKRMIESVESFELGDIPPLQRMLRQKLHDHVALAFVEGA